MSKPRPILLDTHIWVRYINGAPGLKAAAIELIESLRQSGEVFVSVISTWEVAMLVNKGRLTLPMPVELWVAQALRLPGVRLLPLTPEIAIASVQLPLELNGDPADRILVASARIEGLRLMSRDKDILRFAKQTHLPTETA